MTPSVLGSSLIEYAVLVRVDISDVPFIIGYLVNFGLLGILSIQVYIYAREFRRDSKLLRFTVFLVFFLEVVNSTLVLYSAIYGANINCLSCLITGSRDFVFDGVPVSEMLSIWAFQALCIITGLSSSAVQVFFAWRIWALGRSIWVPIAVIVVSLAQFVMLTTEGILSGMNGELGVYDTDGAVIWLMISAVCDILITARTTQLLFQSGGQSSFRRTRSLVRKLIMLTIETGLVTVIATFLEFALAQAFNIEHHGVFYFLSKLYALCLLTTLNARLVIHGDNGFSPNSVSTDISDPAVCEPGDVQLSPTNALGRGPYETRLELHKKLSDTDPAPAPAAGPTMTRRYHTVGVQSNAHTNAEMDMDMGVHASLDGGDLERGRGC